jgi:RNA-directed DNA polymerase
MKRERGLYARIGRPQNLELAFRKAGRAKKHRRDYQAFAGNLKAELAALADELACEQVTVGDYRYFRVFDPKERLICAAPFRERVLHHAIMNVCEDNLERYAVAASYACRPNKGLHRAIADAQSQCRRRRCYLKLDIRRFFDSIDHVIALDMLARRFKDPPLLRLFDCILDSYHATPGKGLPIGNLVSQHLANFYLGRFDGSSPEFVGSWRLLRPFCGVMRSATELSTGSVSAPTSMVPILAEPEPMDNSWRGESVGQ